MKRYFVSFVITSPEAYQFGDLIVDTDGINTETIADLRKQLSLQHTVLRSQINFLSFQLLDS